MDTDPRTWIAVLRRSHDRLASLASFVRNDRLTARSYAREWTIAEVFSHLGSGAELAHLFLDAALTDNTSIDTARFAPVWERWNAKPPADQARDCIEADDAYIARLEQLSAADLSAMRLQIFGMDLDAAGVIRLRLSEHAIHTWDVAVAIDPAAAVAPGAVALLAPHAPEVGQRTARPPAVPFRARVRGSFPDVDWLVDAGETVAVTPWRGAGAEVAGEAWLPAEAILRLFYGRLDPAHAPPARVSGDAEILERLRELFPGL
jgi:uncharacterized protein (TIGR03083 family)